MPSMKVEAVCGLAVLSVIVGLGVSPGLFGQVPPALVATDCGAKDQRGELPNQRFVRHGGQTSRAPVDFVNRALTSTEVNQGRNLSRYDRLDLTIPHFVWAGEEDRDIEIIARARMFIWEHWRDRKRAYLMLTGRSVDATSTSHVFVEEDSDGRWRVYWRILRHYGEIDDMPTYFRVEWVSPDGHRIDNPGNPDPTKNRLDFRDKCGDVERSL